MSKERKYSEKEISAIFKYAASAQELAGQHTTSEDGLSLAELQKIGEGSGINAAFIARAAAALDGNEAGIIQELAFGRPVALKKTISLREKMSDDDWERLVVDLREVFGTEGHLSQEGSFRKWIGLDVKVHVEPDNAAGYRVRIQTGEHRRGIIDFALGMGVIIFLISMIFWVQAIFMGKMVASVLLPGTVFLLTSLICLLPLARLPKLANERISQLQTIAARIMERANLVAPVAEAKPASDEMPAPRLSLGEAAETPASEQRTGQKNPRLRS